MRRWRKGEHKEGYVVVSKYEDLLDGFGGAVLLVEPFAVLVYCSSEDGPFNATNQAALLPGL